MNEFANVLPYALVSLAGGFPSSVSQVMLKKWLFNIHRVRHLIRLHPKMRGTFAGTPAGGRAPAKRKGGARPFAGL